MKINFEWLTWLDTVFGGWDGWVTVWGAGYTTSCLETAGLLTRRPLGGRYEAVRLTELGREALS